MSDSTSSSLTSVWTSLCFLALMILTIWTGFVILPAARDVRQTSKAEVRIQCALHHENASVRRLCREFKP